MGRIERSWDLIGKSWSILVQDKKLMFLPVASAIASGSISIVMLGGYALAFRPEVETFLAAGRSAGHRISQPMWIFLFLFYLVNYFIVVYFNVALVSAASDRLEGGPASIDSGLQTAWERKGRIFQWALLSATVGILLRALEERLGALGRLGVRLFGVAWNFGSYFVVPVLVAEDVGPAEALYQSAQLISETWGEEIAGSFSFGLIFFFLMLPGIALPLILNRILGAAGLIAGIVVTVIYGIILAIVSASLQGIFNAALYRYAKTGEVSSGFALNDFKTAWLPKN
jgi:Family of unknown function (DUF6159)